MHAASLQPNFAWGKLDSRTAGQFTTWHPLIDHMADVAACWLALARCRSTRRALERAAGRALSEVDLARLAVLAFLHDLGKANASFQARRWPEQKWPWPWKGSAAGHSAEAIDVLNDAKLFSALGIDDAFSAWDNTAAINLLVASISHHGRPVHENVSASRTPWQPVLDPHGNIAYDPIAILRDIGQAARRMFPLAFTGEADPLPEAPAFAHLFAGQVQLADWLGSDTRFFAYSEPDEDRLVTAHQCAAKAIAAIGLNVDGLRDQLIALQPSFEDAFPPHPPRPMQSASAALDLGPLVILESETGSGKTEAALWRFAQLFQAGRVDSLYFALPTRVAATQLYERVLRFAHALWPDDTPTVIRALAGYEAADGQSKIAMPDYQVQWADNPDDLTAHRRWAAETPKRFLAANIAVGTIDQALLGTLQVRHAHLRHALLARSLLVVDEVHASDAYMGELLKQLLKAHLQLGGHALLLSATLGSAARSAYLALVQKKHPAPTLEHAIRQPYPALSGPSGPQQVGGSSRSKTISWHAIDIIDQPERIAIQALNAARQGAKVLVIRNTVPAAVATLQALETLVAGKSAESYLFRVAGVSTLHHSRFSRQDRPLLDQAVEQALGKDSQRGHGCIVIGTQTLEQSLDLDADFLICDLCPMDVLLQRIGRLHRHERNEGQRPQAFRSAQALVLVPAGGDLAPMLQRATNGLGLMRLAGGERGGIYPDLRILEATRRLIVAQPTREIPGDNRYLVEHATHPESLCQIEAELGAAWQTLGCDIEGGEGAKRSVARLHTLPFDTEFNALHFPEGEKIATRLGAADRLVEFHAPINGPFGQPVRQLALRHHQLPPDLPADAQVRELVSLDGTISFSLGSTRYRYHRFGLERLKSTTQQDTP